MSKQEAGNFYPDTPEEIPLTLWEAIVIYGGLVAASLVSVAILAFGAGFIFHSLFN